MKWKPQDSNFSHVGEEKVIAATAYNFTVTGLRECTNYRIEISGKTGAGAGKASFESNKTEDGGI